ncbi:hypothetical protein Srufu_008780 [Streptomyces libani subsp. rufus]|nr:hypothetical protein Srufu_008780 [Streptomyces libani subsp. rufus]
MAAGGHSQLRPPARGGVTEWALARAGHTPGTLHPQRTPLPERDVWDSLEKTFLLEPVVLDLDDITTEAVEDYNADPLSGR